MHTHAHTHAHTHTHTHTCTHIHTYIQTDTHTDRHIYTHRHTHTQTHTYMYTQESSICGWEEYCTSSQEVTCVVVGIKHTLTRANPGTGEEGTQHLKQLYRHWELIVMNIVL